MNALPREHAFSNSIIKAPIQGKPHIIFYGGWWRVSEIKYYWRVTSPSARWSAAHNFISKLNNKAKDNE